MALPIKGDFLSEGFSGNINDARRARTFCQYYQQKRKMPKFLVRVNGSNFMFKFEERKMFFWRNSYWKKAGFYTTRFVETESANEAIEKVFDMLKTELQKKGQTTDASTMELVEIREDDEAFDSYAPGGGFTFYIEESK